MIDVTGPSSQWAMPLLGQVVLVGIRKQAEQALESKPVSSIHSSVLPLLLRRSWLHKLVFVMVFTTEKPARTAAKRDVHAWC